MADAKKKAWGDSLRAIARRKTPMGLSTGAAGGYAVPEEVLLQIDAGLAEVGVFHQYARRVEMKTNTVYVPSYDLTVAHATGASPLYAGQQPQWFVENPPAIPESEPSFGQAAMSAANLGCLVYASNQLVDDGGEALAAFLTWEFTQAIIWAVEKDCFSNTLPGRPTGITGAPGTVPVTRQTAGTVTSQDLGSMFGSLLPASIPRSIWACSPTAFKKIAQLGQLFINAEQRYLHGLPLFITEKLPAVGALGDVVLFDPQMYVLGTRSIEIGASTETQSAFEKNQTIFRLFWRGNGRLMVKNTVTLADGSTVVGAAVALN